MYFKNDESLQSYITELCRQGYTVQTEKQNCEHGEQNGCIVFNDFWQVEYVLILCPDCFSKKIELFVKKADSELIEKVWESDIMEELGPDEFIEKYQKLHIEKYGQKLDI